MFSILSDLLLFPGGIFPSYFPVTSLPFALPTISLSSFPTFGASLIQSVNDINSCLDGFTLLCYNLNCIYITRLLSKAYHCLGIALTPFETNFVFSFPLVFDHLMSIYSQFSLLITVTGSVVFFSV